MNVQIRPDSVLSPRAERIASRISREYNDLGQQANLQTGSLQLYRRLYEGRTVPGIRVPIGLIVSLMPVMRKSNFLASLDVGDGELEGFEDARIMKPPGEHASFRMWERLQIVHEDGADLILVSDHEVFDAAQESALVFMTRAVWRHRDW